MYNLYTIDHSIHPSFMMVPDKQPFSYTENHDMDLLLTSGYHPTTTVAAPTPAPLTVATHLPMSMTIPCTDDLFMPNDLKSNMDYSTSQFDFLSLSQNELFYNGPMYWTTPTMHIHRHSLPDNDSSVESCSSLSSFSSGSPVSSPLFYEKPKHNKYSTDNNRPYSCHLCPRAFARKHDLQRHIRVHTGDKPYACPCCKKAFARTDALKRHLRVEEQCRKSQEVQAMKAAGRRRYKNI